MQTSTACGYLTGVTPPRGVTGFPTPRHDANANAREMDHPGREVCLLAVLLPPRLQAARGAPRVVALLGERRALPFGPSGVFAVPARDALIFAFELFVGLTLLFNRAPVRQPEKPPDVLVPLLGTFFIYAFAFAHLAPAPLRESLMPVALRDGAAVAALLVSVAGYAVAVWSVVCLGRSFALLVSVRTVVRRGPYRYVRHPMYLGYIFLFAGILIGALSPIVILLTAVCISLTVWRARLEEDALTRHSGEYRDYAKRTGFLLPRRRAWRPLAEGR